MFRGSRVYACVRVGEVVWVRSHKRECCVLKCNPHVLRLAPQGKTNGLRPAVTIEGKTFVWARGTWYHRTRRASDNGTKKRKGKKGGKNA